MDPKKVAQLLALLNPELAAALAQAIEEKLDLARGNRELRQTLEASNVELNRVNDRRIEAEAERDRLHRENRAGDNSIRHLKEKVEKLEAGIAAYRKRAALFDGQQFRDLDEADAWEASFIDVDGKSTEKETQ